jgi:ribosome-associated translation inhibitor RaiA
MGPPSSLVSEEARSEVSAGIVGTTSVEAVEEKLSRDVRKTPRRMEQKHEYSTAPGFAEKV